MTVTERMEKIESLRFSALVNLASDFRTFLRILGDQPEVQALSAAMESEVVTQDVFRRLLDLANSPVDDAYEHPADAAMAAYLWLLSRKGRAISETAATTILNGKQCWWSRKMADQVGNEPPASPAANGAPAGSDTLLTDRRA